MKKYTKRDIRLLFDKWIQKQKEEFAHRYPKLIKDIDKILDDYSLVESKQTLNAYINKEKVGTIDKKLTHILNEKTDNKIENITKYINQEKDKIEKKHYLKILRILYLSVDIINAQKKESSYGFKVMELSQTLNSCHSLFIDLFKNDYIGNKERERFHTLYTGIQELQREYKETLSTFKFEYIDNEINTLKNNIKKNDNKYAKAQYETEKKYWEFRKEDSTIYLINMIDEYFNSLCKYIELIISRERLFYSSKYHTCNNLLKENTMDIIRSIFVGIRHISDNYYHSDAYQETLNKRINNVEKITYKSSLKKTNIPSIHNIINLVYFEIQQYTKSRIIVIDTGQNGLYTQRENLLKDLIEHIYSVTPNKNKDRLGFTKISLKKDYPTFYKKYHLSTNGDLSDRDNKHYNYFYALYWGAESILYSNK